MSESDWMPRINRDICTGCRACVDTCPTNALAQVESKAALAHPECCTYCLACEDVCPVSAIQLPFLIQLKEQNPCSPNEH